MGSLKPQVCVPRYLCSGAQESVRVLGVYISRSRVNHTWFVRLQTSTSPYPALSSSFKYPAPLCYKVPIRPFTPLPSPHIDSSRQNRGGAWGAVGAQDKEDFLISSQFPRFYCIGKGRQPLLVTIAIILPSFSLLLKSSALITVRHPTSAHEFCRIPLLPNTLEGRRIHFLK